MAFQEVNTSRRKQFESKHHGTARESTLEQQRFNQTEITFSLRKNEVCSCDQAGRQAGRLADKNLLFTKF